MYTLFKYKNYLRNIKSNETDNLVEFIVQSLFDNIILSDSPVNRIQPYQCELPEEYNFHDYWTWIYDQLVPHLDHFIGQYRDNPINIIYIANFENGPSILYRHLQRYFNMSDFDLSNTPNKIYER